MKSIRDLVVALLLVSGLASATAQDQGASEVATAHSVAIRDGDEWSLPTKGPATPKQMENNVKNYEKLGLCYSYKGINLDDRRNIGICTKYCAANPDENRKSRAGQRPRNRRRRGEETGLSLPARAIDHDEALNSMKGVSCYQMDPGPNAQYHQDENGHLWAVGICKCEAPAIAKHIALFVAEGFEKVKEAIEEALKTICATGFALLKGIVDTGISFIPGVGVAIRGVKITAKVVKAAKAAYENNISGQDFFGSWVQDVCGKPPPFDFSPEGIFMALVNLPDSALGNEAAIGCQLSKSNTCKKVQKMAEPKKEVTILPGKNKPDNKKQQDADRKKKEDDERKKKEAAEKKKKEDAEKKQKEAADRKKKEEEKKKKTPSPACNIGIACKSGQN